MATFGLPSLMTGRKRKHGELNDLAQKRRAQGSGHQSTDCEPQELTALATVKDLVSSCTLDTQQSLRDAFKASFNAYVPVMEDERFNEVANSKDDLSTLLNALMMAVGMSVVHDDTVLGIEYLLDLKNKRSRLHQAVKDVIEINDLYADTANHILVLMIFSELERFTGFAGSANVYLREAERLVTGSPQLTSRQTALDALKTWNAQAGSVLHVARQLREEPVTIAQDDIPSSEVDNEFNPFLSGFDYSCLNFGYLDPNAFDKNELPNGLVEDPAVVLGEQMVDPGAPASQTNIEEEVEVISDPVFGAYVDEVKIIRQQSKSPKRRRRSSSQDKTEVPRSRRQSRAEPIDASSSEMWRGNALAEQLRSFLGHDIGFGSPETLDEQNVQEFPIQQSAAVGARL